MQVLMKKVILYKLKLKLYSLPEHERISYLLQFLARYYHYDDDLPFSFYQFCYHEIIKNHSSILDKENIFQVIDEYKGVSFYQNKLDEIITPKQYLDVSIKHIKKLENMICEKLHTCPQNNLDQLYQEEDLYKLSRLPYFLESECLILAYKLYFSIGFVHSLDLLQNRFGEISFTSLYYLFYSIDVKENQGLSKELSDFLFGKKNDNGVMKFILHGQSKELYLNFSYFCQQFSYYYQELQGNLSKRKVEALLQDRFLSYNPIYPDIRRDLVEDMIASFKNKNLASYSEQEIMNFYFRYFENNMKSLQFSSIPQIHVENDGFFADVLALNDPKIFVMGYRANNCFRLDGDASILFSKAVKNKNFRVVSISSGKDRDIAMMLVARNGNVLIGQGIEISKSYQDYENRKKIYQICVKLLNELMLKMNSLNDEIVLNVIGCSNRNVTDFNSDVLSFRVSPFFEGNLFQEFYNGFQFPQCLVSKKSNISFHEIKLFDANQKYFDDREEVICLKSDDYGFKRNLVQQRIMAISYFAGTQKRRLEMQSSHVVKEIYCNKDWYLIVFADGTLDGAYLKNDFRAKEEYELFLEKVSINNFQLK